MGDFDYNYPHDERSRSGCAFVAAIVLIVLSFIFGSCRTERVITIETVRTDTLTRFVNTRDSIYLHDSIYHEVTVHGDTIFVTKDRWHTQYRDRWLHDSIYISHVDSVPVPYEVKVPVPRELTRSQLFFIRAGHVAIILWAGILAWLLWRAAKKVNLWSILVRFIRKQ